jgi:hypothetical protein
MADRACGALAGKRAACGSEWPRATGSALPTGIMQRCDTSYRKPSAINNLRSSRRIPSFRALNPEVSDALRIEQPAHRKRKREKGGRGCSVENWSSMHSGPERAQLLSPGQRPGQGGRALCLRPERAQQLLGLLCPFRARRRRRSLSVCRSPGRCPGLSCCAPSGRKSSSLWKAARGECSAC